MITHQKVEVELDYNEMLELLRDGLRYRGYRNVGKVEIFTTMHQPHWPEDFASYATIDGATIIAEEKQNERV